MTPRRKFKRSGDTVIDVYGRSGAGKVVSFRAPLAAMKHLRTTEPLSRPVAFAPEALAARRVALRERLRSTPVVELTNADFIEAKSLRTPSVGVLLQRRFKEMEEQWRGEDASTLACGASALLLMNPGHTGAASALTRMVFSSAVSEFVRTMAAGQLSDAFQPAIESEAMLHLGDALMRLIRGTESVRWGPFAYTCVSHMIQLEPRETMQLCREELRRGDEHDRRTLVNALAERSGSHVLSFLLGYAPHESSIRVQLSLINVLGDLLSERRRLKILASGLHDVSPSLRWLAIKSLHRLRSSLARDLARAAISSEPDPLLKRLLREVAAAAP